MRFLRHFFKVIANRIRMARYDDFTIAGHFRRLGADIGEDNRLEIRTLGPEPYLVSIGNHCTIAQHVAFLVHDGATWVFSEEIPGIQKFGPVRVLDNCFIGYRSIIMGNVTIGPNSVVGAGSIVTKDVPPNVVVAGNPARVICTLDEYKRKVTAAWKEQKPPGYLKDIEKGGKYPSSRIQDMKIRDAQMLREHLTRLFAAGARKAPAIKQGEQPGRQRRTNQPVL